VGWGNAAMHLHEVDGLVGLLVQAARIRRGLFVPGLGPIGPPQIAVLVALAAAPFVVWLAKRRIDRWEERQRREEARRCAVDVAVALAKSIQLCEDVRLAIQTADRLPDDIVEAAIGSLARSRQMLRVYLRRHIPLHELIPLAAAAEKRLGEGCQAMQALQTPPPGVGAQRDAAYANQLQTVRAELQSVVERLQGLQPDLARAIAKVDAGWALSD
jgi:hypothetical protein